MQTHSKNNENKNQAVANNIEHNQTDFKPTLQFVDNRPEAITQRKLAEMINSSPQAAQAANYQEMIDNSPQVEQAAQFQKTVDNFTSNPIQKAADLEEEELLQGKFKNNNTDTKAAIPNFLSQQTIQKQADLEEEELLQGKFKNNNTETKAAIPNFLSQQTIQKQADLEEEELLQGKFKNNNTDKNAEIPNFLSHQTIQKQADLEEEELLQGKFKGNKTDKSAEIPNFISQQAIQKKENKTGMPDNLKSGIEQLSGLDMSDVRVHHNSSKPASVQAHAYTQGTDIYIASGQDKHLPHEAWHVAQQKQGRVKPTTKVAGLPVNDNKALEKEADEMGNKAIQMRQGGYDSDHERKEGGVGRLFEMEVLQRNREARDKKGKGNQKREKEGVDEFVGEETIAALTAELVEAIEGIYEKGGMEEEKSGMESGLIQRWEFPDWMGGLVSKVIGVIKLCTLRQGMKIKIPIMIAISIYGLYSVHKKGGKIDAYGTEILKQMLSFGLGWMAKAGGLTAEALVIVGETGFDEYANEG